jgi:hypothetical protein
MELGAPLAWRHQWCRSVETVENAERQNYTYGTSEITIEYWDTGNQLFLFYDRRGVIKPLSIDKKIVTVFLGLRD